MVFCARTGEALGVADVCGKKPGKIVVGVIFHARVGSGFIVLGIHVTAQAKLFHVVHARDLPGFFLGAREGGQKHAGEDRDDGNDHKQFDEREAAAARMG